MWVGVGMWVYSRSLGVTTVCVDFGGVLSVIGLTVQAIRVPFSIALVEHSVVPLVQLFLCAVLLPEPHPSCI